MHSEETTRHVPHATRTGSWALRPLTEGDFDQWRALWEAYLAFYREHLPDEVTRHTFARLCARDEAIFAVVAQETSASDGGVLVGIAHGVVHPSTWSASPTCYLEDLFVAPRARGTGAARALIDAVATEAQRRGADRLYWHTQEFNGPARSLYDQVASRLSYVVYERQLASPHGH